MPKKRNNKITLEPKTTTKPLKCGLDKPITKPIIKPKKSASGKSHRFTEENFLNIVNGWVGSDSCLARACDIEGFKITTFFRYLGIKELSDGRSPNEVYACAREAKAEREIGKLDKVFDEAGIDPQAARVRADIIKYRASKFAPKTWGDKIDVEHSGSVATTLMGEIKVNGQVFKPNFGNSKDGK
jgi:hypothetical protein